MADEWNLMTHANLFGVYEIKAERVAAARSSRAGMLMGMAQRPAGDGTLAVRAMLSPDPLMGKRGYPLLFGTGETADGRKELIDRPASARSVRRTVPRPTAGT